MFFIFLVISQVLVLVKIFHKIELYFFLMWRVAEGSCYYQHRMNVILR